MNTFLKTISALNDETRILLLRFLDRHGELCVCDLQRSLDMIQSRLSRHLKILKEAEFLKVERRGTWAYYRINDSLNRFQQEAMDEIRDIYMDLPPLKLGTRSFECKIQ